MSLNSGKSQSFKVRNMAEKKTKKKKKVSAVVKIRIAAGQASPAPPVGTALGPTGVNMMEFCKAYNEQTQNLSGQIIPAVITIYEDRSFEFILKTQPAAEEIKKAANIEKGAENPRTDEAGQITKAQIKEIAEKKMADLNAINIEGAMLQIEGTARSMGVKVVA